MKSRYVEFSEEGVVNVKEEEVSSEHLGPMEVVLRTEASLISAGTELSRLHNVLGNSSYPCKSGYASVGKVVVKGEAVTDFDVGDRVFFAGKHASVQRFQHGQDHQWGRLYPVPDGVRLEDAPFVCLAEIAMAAPCVTGVDLNDTVAVFGLGLVGNLAAQQYRLLGGRVIGLDPVTKRCELAREVGIETVLDVPPERQVGSIMELTDGEGAYVAVDAAGHSAVIEACVKAAALFGKVALLGTPRAEYTADMTPVLMQIHEKGLEVRGAHQWRFPAMEIREVKKTVPWGFRTMFDLMMAGKLRVEPLRSHFVEPGRAPEVYEGLLNRRDEYWGVVFDWTSA